MTTGYQKFKEITDTMKPSVSVPHVDPEIVEQEIEQDFEKAISIDDLGEQTDQKKDIVISDAENEKKRIALAQKTIAKGLTADEFKLFWMVATRSGLDPFARQIYAIKRNSWNPQTKRMEPVMTIQTSIDGYRAIAERTKDLAGISDVTYDTEAKEHPNKATITVQRVDKTGQRAEYTSTARWSEYAQIGKDGKPTKMWQKMPYLMLGKCAEALALRKAFPHDLSGLYTHEEMSQASNEEK